MKKKNNNLSQNEADTFLTYAKKVLDLIVVNDWRKTFFWG